MRCSLRNVVLTNFTKLTEKHLCKSLFFNKVADLRPATLLKKKLWHRGFPVNFAKRLRTSFLQSTYRRLLPQLLAATLNTHAGETVKRAFQDNHKRSVKLSDSQVTLHRINNQNEPLKQWLKNRIVEINRLPQPKDWLFVRSEDIIADIGTRRVSYLDVVGKDSLWSNGFDWMKWDKASLPADN